MINLNVIDETSTLEAVIVGIPDSFGGTPLAKEAYDPKSRQHILNGTFPKQHAIESEMDELCAVLEKYQVEVLRPEEIEGLNQIFARDIGIVKGDKFIIPQILSNRSAEIEGIRFLINQVEPHKRLSVPGDARIEGGDIMPWQGKIFAGYSKKADFNTYTVARTNEAGIRFLEQNFEGWEVYAFELKKSATEPR